MSVTNGQDANETTFNNAFVSRTTDTSTTGKVDLENADTTTLVDTQRVVNEIADQNGIANQAATDANAKVYSSNNVITDGDDQKVAIGKLDGAFDTTTGHDHDGVNSKALDAANLSNVNNLFGEFQEKTFDAASGTSIDVSTDFASDTPGGDAVTEGVITTVPNNLLSVAEKDTGGEIEDGSGRRVFGRLTEAAGVWTVSFFVNIAGTETAHNLSSQDIKYLYREVFNQNDRPTIGANVAAYDTVNAVNDIPDATASQAGKVNTGAQTFGGVKEFASRPTTNSIDIVDISASQVITNKDLDGGTASNTNRWTVPKNTTANLTALTRKEATVFYDTDEQNFFGDDGTDIIPLGGGGAGGGLDVFYTDNFEDTKAIDFSSGNSAIFDNGGVLDGTLADDEVSPINGERSITYTMGAASTNDWFYPLSIPISEKQQGQFFSATLYAKYDGAVGDIKALVWDDTNNMELVSVEQDSSDSSRYTMTGFIPMSTTALKMGFQVLVGNNGQIIEFDDFEMSLNPFVLATASAPDSQIRVHTSNGYGSTNTKIRRFTTIVDDFGSAITYTDSATDGGLFTINEPGVYYISHSDTSGVGTSHMGLSLNSTQLTTNIGTITAADRLAIAEIPDANGNNFCGWSGFLSAGDEIRAHADGSAGGTAAWGSFTITKEGKQEVTVVENASAANSMVRVQGANGFGSTNTKIRRFSNILETTGSDVTYADSATDGALFTVNSDGLYNISLSETAGSATSHVGVSKNSTQLTTNIGSITAADRLMIFEVPDNNGNSSSSITLQLSAGDLIRPHSQGNAGGTAAWGTMTVAKIGTTQTTGVPLPRVAYIKDVKSSGTNGGTFTAGSYQTRDLNTLEGDSDFITLSSNQFTLPAGKYDIECQAPCATVNNQKAKIRNITDATDAIMGGVRQTTSGTTVQVNTPVIGRIEITSAKTFEVQHRCSVTAVSFGFGTAASFGDDEVYTIVKITKVE